MDEETLLDIEDITYDHDYYPRQTVDVEDTVARYIEHLRSRPTFNFNPIYVVLRESSPRYLILDGVHRWLAYQQAGRTKIPAYIEQLPESDWFKRAVELNLNHGRPFQVSDREHLVGRLRRDGFTLEYIAEFIKVRVDTIRGIDPPPARFAVNRPKARPDKPPGHLRPNAAPIYPRSARSGTAASRVKKDLASEVPEESDTESAVTACRTASILDDALKLFTRNRKLLEPPEIQAKLRQLRQYIDNLLCD